METRSGPRRLVKTRWTVPFGSSRSATIARPFASNHSFAGDALPNAQSSAIARSQAIAPLPVARDKRCGAGSLVNAHHSPDFLVWRQTKGRTDSSAFEKNGQRNAGQALRPARSIGRGGEWQLARNTKSPDATGKP